MSCGFFASVLKASLTNLQVNSPLSRCDKVWYGTCLFLLTDKRLIFLRLPSTHNNQLSSQPATEIWWTQRTYDFIRTRFFLRVHTASLKVCKTCVVHIALSDTRTCRISSSTPDASTTGHKKVNWWWILEHFWSEYWISCVHMLRH